jgi:hypothetical protein
MEILMHKLFCFVGVRDYIHVMDLASGHVAALNKLKKEHLRLKVGKLEKNCRHRRVRQEISFMVYNFIMTDVH